MKLNLKFGTAVTVLPTAAVEKIIAGAATQEETAVLLAIATAPDFETDTDEEYLQMISDVTGIDTDEVNSAIAFWRGASVLTVAGKSKSTKNANKPVIPAKTAEPAVVQQPEEIFTAPVPEPVKEEPAKVEPQKKLMKEELPKYDSLTISEICGRDGGMLTAVIDQCQQIFERMFNPNDVSVIVALNDYLGLEPEYILILCAYYAKKRPGCKLPYIEKTAYSLVNEGITTVPALEAHIKSMEIYDGVAGKLRKLMGIGDRAFTKKENTKLSHWINDLGYGSDVIEFCYDITVNSIGEFKFDYADKVIEGWYSSGVRCLEDAVKAAESFRLQNERKPQNAVGGITESTFDGDEFMKLAIQRSIQ